MIVEIAEAVSIVVHKEIIVPPLDGGGQLVSSQSFSHRAA